MVYTIKISMAVLTVVFLWHQAGHLELEDREESERKLLLPTKCPTKKFKCSYSAISIYSMLSKQYVALCKASKVAINCYRNTTVYSEIFHFQKTRVLLECDHNWIETSGIITSGCVWWIGICNGCWFTAVTVVQNVADQLFASCIDSMVQQTAARWVQRCEVCSTQVQLLQLLIKLGLN